MNKKIIIICSILITVVIATTAAILIIFNMPENRLNRHLKLGNKYLNEGDFEQAAVEYNKAIAIDPLNVDAYLGMADAYVGMNDFAEAKNALQRGLGAYKAYIEAMGFDAALLDIGGGGDGLSGEGGSYDDAGGLDHGMTGGEGGSDDASVLTETVSGEMSVSLSEKEVSDRIIIIKEKLKEIEALEKEAGNSAVNDIPIQVENTVTPGDGNGLAGNSGSYSGSDTANGAQQNADYPYIELPFEPGDFKITGFSIYDGYNKDAMAGKMQGEMDLSQAPMKVPFNVLFYNAFDTNFSVGYSNDPVSPTVANYFAEGRVEFLYPDILGSEGWGGGMSIYPCPYLDTPEVFHKNIVNYSEFPVFEEIKNNAYNDNGTYRFTSNYGINSCKVWAEHDIYELQYNMNGTDYYILFIFDGGSNSLVMVTVSKTPYSGA